MSTKAAYLPSPHHPLKVSPTPPRYPDETELLIRTAAVTINQLDWKIQETPWADFAYPLILGEDVAGTVLRVGSAVTRFKPGDRVIGHAVGFATGDERHGAFHETVVVMENMACVLPAGMGFERGVVLPLGVSTAAAGLFQGDFLGLPLPLSGREKKQGDGGQTVLVWGASSSVGCNVVQMAVAAVCEVVATASEKNFEYVRGLGPGVVVDYRGENVVQELIKVFNGGGRVLAGAFDAVGVEDSGRRTVEVVKSVEKGKKMVVSVLEVPQDLLEGVIGRNVQAVDIRENEVGEMVYGDFLPRALEEGTYVPAPEPYIAGFGLEAIQGAFEVQKKVSARKVVVTLF